MHIKNRELLEGEWRVVQEENDLREGEFVLLPLAEWVSNFEGSVVSPKNVGAWISVDFDVSDLKTVPDVLAVYFKEFTDGRGYSLARLIRDRLNFKGDLIAIGDILRDPLWDLERCGFNAFVMRSDQDVNEALNAFNEFDVTYQPVTSSLGSINDSVKSGA